MEIGQRSNYKVFSNIEKNNSALMIKYKNLLCVMQYRNFYIPC